MCNYLQKIWQTISDIAKKLTQIIFLSYENYVKSHQTWRKKQAQDHLQQTQLRRVKEKKKQKKKKKTKSQKRERSRESVPKKLKFKVFS